MKSALAWVPAEVGHMALQGRGQTMNGQESEDVQDNTYIELDTKSLAKSCLMVIGREMGI